MCKENCEPQREVLESQLTKRNSNFIQDTRSNTPAGMVTEGSTWAPAGITTYSTGGHNATVETPLAASVWTQASGAGEFI